MKTEIIINGKTMHVETGHTYREWLEIYGKNHDVWFIAMEDFITGAVEVNEDILYWLTDKGLCCETDIYMVNEHGSLIQDIYDVLMKNTQYITQDLFLEQYKDYEFEYTTDGEPHVNITTPNGDILKLTIL